MSRLTGVGLPAAAGLLLAMEAGVPIPIPADIVLLLLGERVASGALPLGPTVAALQVVTVLGTVALFLAVRGPGQVILNRVGPRIGLTPERLERATSFVERRGRPALAIGRATPGLRTVTVAAAAGSTLRPMRALVPLILGATIFNQGHLMAGYAFGPTVKETIEQARGPVLLSVAAAVVAGGTFWIIRRGRRAGSQSASEACCPACLALGVIVPRVAGLRSLEPLKRGSAQAP